MMPMCGSIDVAFRLVYVCCEPLLLACSVNNSDSTPGYLYITITISNVIQILYHQFHIVNLSLSFLPFNRWVHLLPSLMVLTVMKRYVAMRGIDTPVCNIEISLKGWSSNRLGSGWNHVSLSSLISWSVTIVCIDMGDKNWGTSGVKDHRCGYEVNASGHIIKTQRGVHHQGMVITDQTHFDYLLCTHALPTILSTWCNSHDLSIQAVFVHCC